MNDKSPKVGEQRINVVVEGGGHYNGRFQVWDRDGNEISKNREKQLQRLFAAAPELLNTIKDIQHSAQAMNQAEPNRVWAAIDDACRAAIAKAEVA